ncbi:MAG: class I tRNA ligase family protein, partial [Oscillospiraceae bacterium]
DIIFFWVARMIFSGLEHTGQKPFDTVFIHGIVRDEQGRKMSKSLGNGIDPLEIISEYGADALRFMLASGTSPGNDMRFSEEKVRSARNFCNKIWNAARFILMNDVSDVKPDLLPETLELEDRWLISRLNSLIADTSENLDRFDLGIAAGKLYDFTWDVFCDWYIEIAKLRLGGDDERKKLACKQVLVYAETQILKLLHPFIPFITEEIYQAIPHSCESIMISEFPTYDETLVFETEEAEFSKIMDVIKAVRVLRADMNVPPSKKTTIYIETPLADVFARGEVFIKRLAGAERVVISASADISAEGTAQTVTDCARVLIPMAELVDTEKELLRLQNELAKAQKEITSLEARLANEQFTSKAPSNVIEGERDKLARAVERRSNIEQSIAKLK